MYEIIAGLATQIRILRKRIDNLDMSKVDPKDLQAAINSLKDLENRYTDILEKKKNRKIEKENREKELTQKKESTPDIPKIEDDKVIMPKKEFVEEHEKLVDILETPAEEAKEQKKELEEVKEAADPGGTPFPTMKPGKTCPTCGGEMKQHPSWHPAAPAVSFCPVCQPDVAVPKPEITPKAVSEQEKTSDEEPNLDTIMAEAIYMKMLQYLLMTDDPQVEEVMKIRKAIDKIQSPSDKEKLVQAFNKEFGGHHTDNPWEYYAKAAMEPKKEVVTNKYNLDDVVEPVYGTPGSLGRVMRYEADKDLTYVAWDHGKLKDDHGFGAYKGSDLRKRAAKVTKCVKCDKELPVSEMVENAHGAGYLCKEDAKEWNREKQAAIGDSPEDRAIYLEAKNALNTVLKKFNAVVASNSYERILDNLIRDLKDDIKAGQGNLSEWKRKEWAIEAAGAVFNDAVRQGYIESIDGKPVIKKDASNKLAIDRQTAINQGLDPVFPEGSKYGDRIFYDAHEGKYYDAASDRFLEYEEIAAFGLGIQNIKKSTITKEARIVEKSDGWYVVSEKGKNLGGPYKSKEQAIKRLKTVEYFKHKGSLIKAEEISFSEVYQEQLKDHAGDKYKAMEATLSLWTGGLFDAAEGEQRKKFIEEALAKVEKVSSEQSGIGYGGDRDGIAVAPKRDEDVSLNAEEESFEGFCQLCGGNLVTLGTLGDRTHTKCESCGMQFSYKAETKKEAVDEKLKPKCPYCSKSFDTWQIYQEHLQKEHALSKTVDVVSTKDDMVLHIGGNVWLAKRPTAKHGISSGYVIFNNNNQQVMFIKVESELSKEQLEQIVFNELGKRELVNATLNSDLAILKKGSKVKVVAIDVTRQEIKFVSIDKPSIAGWSKFGKFDLEIEARQPKIDKPCEICGKIVGMTFEDKVLCRDCERKQKKEEPKKSSKNTDFMNITNVKALTRLMDECPDCYKKFLKFATEKGLRIQADDLTDQVETIKTKITQTKETLQNQTQAALPNASDSYVIMGDELGEQVFWSNDIGWVGDKESATIFTAQEVDRFNLPIGKNVHWVQAASETVETKAAFPSSRIRLEEGSLGGTYIIRNLDAAPSANKEANTVFIQTDWDYPGVASTFGWSHEHRETDGTVDCPKCGKTASQMIQEAQKWLDDHIGAEAEDPGYFSSETVEGKVETKAMQPMPTEPITDPNYEWVYKPDQDKWFKQRKPGT